MTSKRMFISQKEDTPKYWTFQEDPNNSSYFTIYTNQNNSEGSPVTISLVTKVVNDIRPRSNTIVGEESTENYIFDVRFTAIGRVK